MALPDGSLTGEFTVVIMAGGSAHGLYPLTDDVPLSLLPVANRPLISYQLEMLARSGTKRVIVLAGPSMARSLAHSLELLGDIRGLRVTLEVVDEEDAGSATALRCLADKIKTDFVVVSGDLIADVKLEHLADVHRMKDATLTMLLATRRSEGKGAKGSGSSKGKGGGLDPDALETRDIVALNEDDSRIVHITSAADLEESDGFSLRRSLLRRYPRLAVRSTLVDTHVYIFSRWVLDLLVERPSITSIKAHLIPLLVNKQFRKKNLESVAHLAAPDLGLMGIEPVTLASGSGPATPAAVAAGGALALPQAQAPAFASSGPVSPAEVAADLIRCHYYLATDETYARRISTVQQYIAANRDIPAKNQVSQFRPLVPPSQRLQYIDEAVELPSPNMVGSESCVGKSTVLRDAALIKKSNVGAHCVIGAGSKIVNSVVMDYVTVAPGCTITNTVLGVRANIGDNSVLTACRVATDAIVEPDTQADGKDFLKDQVY